MCFLIIKYFVTNIKLDDEKLIFEYYSYRNCSVYTA